jgi:hypothetical protein
MGASARSNRIALLIDGPRPAASVTKKALDHYKAYPGVNTTTIAQLRMQQFALADNPEWIAYNESLFDGLRKAGMPES